jgi:hypothetical protein
MAEHHTSEEFAVWLSGASFMATTASASVTRAAPMAASARGTGPEITV